MIYLTDDVIVKITISHIHPSMTVILTLFGKHSLFPLLVNGTEQSTHDNADLKSRFLKIVTVTFCAFLRVYVKQNATG